MESTDRLTIIYALTDPHTEEVRYVGQRYGNDSPEHGPLLVGGLSCIWSKPCSSRMRGSGHPPKPPP
jgi:hypothetical protein